MADYDPLHVVARSVLLDALEALGPHRVAVIVVGAQAIYLRTDDAGIPEPPYTTDADFALAPRDLADEPLLEQLMADADFRLSGQPGIWFKTVVHAGREVDVEVDLMVPEALSGGRGRRSVELGPHDKKAARRTTGLEGTIIDNDTIDVTALNADDPRHFAVRVAGPAGLLVAKLYKIRDRLAAGRVDRIADKDAGDVYRLMLGIPFAEFRGRVCRLLDDDLSRQVTITALTHLRELFGAPAAQGVMMATESLRTAVPEERIQGVCTGFVRQIVDTIHMSES